MITLRLVEPWENPVRCGARRGRSKVVFCTRPALHDGHHATVRRSMFIWGTCLRVAPHL